MTDRRETPQERTATIEAFLARHADLLQNLGLHGNLDSFSRLEAKTIDYRGIRTEVDADDETRITTEEFLRPALLDPEAARVWLTGIRDELSARLRESLAEAERAIVALADALLRPEELGWLGGEDLVRQRYLSFPASLAVDEAVTSATRRLKAASSIAAKARLDTATSRVRQHTEARLTGKSLRQRYLIQLPFRQTSMTLELHIEKTLDRTDLERLATEPEASLPAVVDRLLSGPRESLKAKVQAQIDELSRKIRGLPHVELLTDQDLVDVIAPYYGGLNQALKKRRARTALVAVEERAREAKYQDDVFKLNEHRDAYADVASYYPAARGLKRRLVLYVGPTNSGKTWRALNALAEADSGTYLAPLRLLALEGQEELEKRGKPTSFITGEERDLKPDARFTSSTIEMLNLEARVDAVVIDEVQLLADERRGWAWLAAVLGAPAETVIMTGSPDCVDLVKELASYLGEDLEIHECQRFNELRVAEEPMRLRDIRAGTAVVCFSRRDVLRIKETIQENSPHKVAVVYGNLSPQVRREEARRFRSGEADILVATDAIAMGLNLPILEVLFYTTEKFNGEEVVDLAPSDIRQIAGRAGRYGVAKYGVVNALRGQSLELIRKALRDTPPMLAPPCYVAPGPNHVRVISEVLGTTSLERVLTFFERAIEFSDERFARSNIDDLSYLSTFVDQKVPQLPVTERLTLAAAPVAIRNETVVGWFLERMLPAFHDRDNPEGDPRPVDELFDQARAFEHARPGNPQHMRQAEDYLKALTVYAWLAYRYPDVYSRIEDCEICRETVNVYVERSLRSTASRRCSACDAKLPAEHRFPTCNQCHAKRARQGESPQPRQGRGGGGHHGKGRSRRS